MLYKSDTASIAIHPHTTVLVPPLHLFLVSRTKISMILPSAYFQVKGFSQDDLEYLLNVYAM